MRGPIILYDADCGFCNWSLAKILSWDRRRRLRPVALQEPEADALLNGMESESRMASWHLVVEGRVESAGSAIAPLLRMLPAGAPFAVLAARFPRVTERAYAWVAANRGLLGRLVSRIAGRAAVERAARRIGERRASFL